MKKIIEFLMNLTALITVTLMLIFIIDRTSKSSIFNAFSKIKIFELTQLFIGFIYSLSIYLAIQILSINFHGFIKTYLPKYEKQSYKFFSLICELSVPIFFVIWMLLSLRETQFNILTNVLASLALFSNLKLGNSIFSKLEMFKSTFDLYEDKK
ncbi:Uncharacterised protein [Streptococcus porcinus]|uniref:hypothetical protein n=1 Tax=Streptococcus porcinus TaxID=1340 RepID=UPI0010CAC6A6|nr:hypothetical protein [Streptococcus porcinus]VTS33179.1 Uncharacterised protein [Streptococcus porcinus]